MACSLDQGLVINGHRYRLAHFPMAGQHRVVEVEVQRLKVDLDGRIDERIILEALILLKVMYIYESNGGLEGARLTLDIGENHLVQVGQPFTSAVVPGVAHQRVVITWH